MSVELGLGGLGLLIVLSVGFGVIAQVVFGRAATRWLWLISAAGWFVGGLVASEVVWGDLTVDEIQPVIDGLAFDESLLGGLVVGLPVAIVTWYMTRQSRAHQPMSS